jgi:hypothetical protein
MDWGHVESLAKTAWSIFSILVLMFSALYFAVRAKLRDEFCMKKDCKEKHDSLDKTCEKKHGDLSNSMLVYRESISDDIKEIKEIVVRIEGRFYDWLNKNVPK